MAERKAPTAEFLRELANRLGDEDKKARAQALWEIIQEEVGNELDNRFHAVVGQTNNTLQAALVAEHPSKNEATGLVSYRMGLKVNGRELEAVVSVPMEAALLDGRHAVMDALKASLAEQLAGLLLSGFSWPRGR